MAGLILISSYFEVLDFTLFVTQFDVLKKPKVQSSGEIEDFVELDLYSLCTEEVHTQATVQHQVSLLLSCGLGPVVGASTLLLLFLLLLLLSLLLLLLLFKSSHGWSCIFAQKNPSAIEFFMRVTNCRSMKQFHEYIVFLGLRHRSLVGLRERMPSKSFLE